MLAGSEAKKFVGYLSFDEAQGQWRVRSVDVSQTGILHKVTFPEFPALGEVFVPEVARHLLDHLGQMDPEGEMLSNSDFQLIMPGFVLHKIRLRTSRSATRGYEASFWFGGCDGQPLLALAQFETSIASLTVDGQAENLAVRTIDRVLIPALNLVASVRSGVRTEQNFELFEGQTDRLVQQADELIMYAELVKRLALEARKDGSSKIEARDLVQIPRRIASGG